jgi:hypothetical protein
MLGTIDTKAVLIFYERWYYSTVLKINIKIYETVIFPVVFYGCETISLTLREEY